MPFPPINLHQRISSSPGRDLFRKKKPSVNKPTEEERDSDKDKMSTSWTAAANLRNLGRKPPAEKTKCLAQRPAAASPETQSKGVSRLTASPKARDSRDSGVTRSSSAESANQRSGKQPSREESGGGGEVRFRLSLTPEAITVLQRRNMEKQMAARQQTKCCGSADFRHRKVFPSSSRKAAAGGSTVQDIRTIVQVSLLNEQHRYDDVEYEEEEEGDAVDQTVVLKVTEWLRGLESAAAFGKVDTVSTALPHLKGS